MMATLRGDAAFEVGSALARVDLDDPESFTEAVDAVKAYALEKMGNAGSNAVGHPGGELEALERKYGNVGYQDVFYLARLDLHLPPSTVPLPRPSSYVVAKRLEAAGFPIGDSLLSWHAPTHPFHLPVDISNAIDGTNPPRPESVLYTTLDNSTTFSPHLFSAPLDDLDEQTILKSVPPRTASKAPGATLFPQPQPQSQPTEVEQSPDSKSDMFGKALGKALSVPFSNNGMYYAGGDFTVPTTTNAPGDARKRGHHEPPSRSQKEKDAKPQNTKHQAPTEGQGQDYSTSPALESEKGSPKEMLLTPNHPPTLPSSHGSPLLGVQNPLVGSRPESGVMPMALPVPSAEVYKNEKHANAAYPVRPAESVDTSSRWSDRSYADTRYSSMSQPRSANDAEDHIRELFNALPPEAQALAFARLAEKREREAELAAKREQDLQWQRESERARLEREAELARREREQEAELARRESEREADLARRESELARKEREMELAREERVNDVARTRQELEKDLARQAQESELERMAWEIASSERERELAAKREMEEKAAKEAKDSDKASTRSKSRWGRSKSKGETKSKPPKVKEAKPKRSIPATSSGWAARGMYLADEGVPVVRPAASASSKDISSLQRSDSRSTTTTASSSYGASTRYGPSAPPSIAPTTPKTAPPSIAPPVPPLPTTPLPTTARPPSVAPSQQSSAAEYRWPQHELRGPPRPVRDELRGPPPPLRDPPPPPREALPPPPSQQPSSYRRPAVPRRQLPKQDEQVELEAQLTQLLEAQTLPQVPDIHRRPSLASSSAPVSAAASAAVSPVARNLSQRGEVRSATPPAAPLPRALGPQPTARVMSDPVAPPFGSIPPRPAHAPASRPVSSLLGHDTSRLEISRHESARYEPSHRSASHHPSRVDTWRYDASRHHDIPQHHDPARHHETSRYEQSQYDHRRQHDASRHEKSRHDISHHDSSRHTSPSPQVSVVSSPQIPPDVPHGMFDLSGPLPPPPIPKAKAPANVGTHADPNGDNSGADGEIRAALTAKIRALQAALATLDVTDVEEPPAPRGGNDRFSALEPLSRTLAPLAPQSLPASPNPGYRRAPSTGGHSRSQTPTARPRDSVHLNLNLPAPAPRPARTRPLALAPLQLPPIIQDDITPSSSRPSSDLGQNDYVDIDDARDAMVRHTPPPEYNAVGTRF